MARKKFLSAREQGIALITSLLFLLVVTLISVTAANSSALGLRMSANMQDAYQSFSAAEAGIYAALGQSGLGARSFYATGRCGSAFCVGNPAPTARYGH